MPRRAAYGYPTTFDVVTSSGELYAFDFTTGTTAAVSRPACNITSGAAIAVNVARDLVVADEEGSVFLAKADGTCTKSLLVGVPSAMAFYYQAGVEVLYALLGTKLATVDIPSFALNAVANLSPAPTGAVRGLASTADGRLLLLTQEADLSIVISSLDRTTGAVSTITTVGHQGDPLPPVRFVGGAPTPTGFELVFGDGVWTYASATTALTFHAALPTNDAGVAGVGKWPCAP